jgi:hypothetical protein
METEQNLVMKCMKIVSMNLDVSQDIVLDAIKNATYEQRLETLYVLFSRLRHKIPKDILLEVDSLQTVKDRVKAYNRYQGYTRDDLKEIEVVAELWE